MNNSDKPRKSPLSYLEPAILVTLLGASLYLVGRSYQVGFKTRLGLGVWLDNDPIHNIVAAQQTIFVFIIYIALGVFPLKILSLVSHPKFIQIVAKYQRRLPFLGFFERFARDPVVSTGFGMLIANVPLLILGLNFFFWGQGILQKGENGSAYFVVASVLIGTMIYYAIKKQTFYDRLLHGSLLERMVVMFILIMASLYFAGETGKTSAESTIEKNFTNNTVVQFKWKIAQPVELEGKELILIEHYDGKYFVVASQKPAPQYPIAYVISDDQIEFATIKTVKR